MWSPPSLGVPQLKPQTLELRRHEQATEAKPCGLLPPARPGCACHAVKTEFILIQTSVIQSTKPRFFFRTATNYPPPLLAALRPAYGKRWLRGGRGGRQGREPRGASRLQEGAQGGAGGSRNAGRTRTSGRDRKHQPQNHHSNKSNEPR